MTFTIADHKGPFSVDREVSVPMPARDGVVLRSDVYRPRGDGPFPVLLRRTPYGKQENDLAAEFNEAHFFASHGYIVVIQDTRGRYSSDGVWSFAEGPDTYDAVEWAAALPGSSGAVGMFGQSYGSLVQYAVATLQPPHLRTCIPIAGPVPGLPGNGFVDLSWNLGYSLEMAREPAYRDGRGAEFEELRRAVVADPEQRFAPMKLEMLLDLPLEVWRERIGDAANRMLDGAAAAGRPIPDTDLQSLYEKYTIPILHVGSWYDSNQWATTTIYAGVRDHGGTELARRNQAILMGPWAHLLPYNLPTSGGTGDIDFGPDAAIFLLDAELAWFDHYLKDGGTELPRATARIFVMGENRWRDEHEWPPARARKEVWYLHSEGNANGLDGDGRLDGTAPGDEPADTYTYDPRDPVITCGGHIIIGGGVYDQRKNESRADVLVYTGAPLAADTELTGPVRLVLHASTTATDTDFFATLVDVRPDGYAHNLVEGGVRLRHRNRGAIEAAVPGEVYELTLDLWSSCHVVRAGHRLRVHLTSSDFPRYDRNANTGGLPGAERELVVAQQRVLHDTQHPTRLEVTVVPR